MPGKILLDCWSTVDEHKTHRALLICVEEIEKDSLEKLGHDFLKQWDDKSREMNLAPLEKRLRQLLEQKGWGDGDNKNQLHREAHGTSLSGIKSPHAILNDEKVREIRRLYASGVRLKHLSEKFNIGPGHAWAVAKRKAWKHVS